RYLVLDAAREAHRHGVPFGRIVDPLGDGVAIALAGFFAAAAIGLERRYVEHVMAGIWSRGLSLTRPVELDRLLASVGVSRRALEAQRANASNEETLKANEAALSRYDLWGVPTVLVDDRAVWGQDRLWQCRE
ncbi:MAG: DsbA family protein, partial [Pseudomonadota bacterium]